MPYLRFSRIDLGAMKRRCESEYKRSALFGPIRRTVKKAVPGGPSRMVSPTFRSSNLGTILSALDVSRKP
jgi:hypothetical protein